MKIAVLDADPRICGPMSWQQHLLSGFRELGHEASLVCSSKSGKTLSNWGKEKPGGHWSAYQPEVVVKESQLVEALDSFDLIILPEPKVPLPDKQATKAGTVPVYVTALLATKTPFITSLHGNDYDPKSAPFARTLLEAPNFVGTIISHSDRSRNSDEFVKSLPYIHSVLPYRPSRGLGGRILPKGVIGTTGRFIFNKGTHVAGLATPYMPEGTSVELWGSCSLGRSASPTYLVFEALVDRAVAAKRDAEKINYDLGQWGNVVSPYTWRIDLAGDRRLSYMGAYSDPIAVAERFTIHLNLSSWKYTGGLVEFSTLEAMDAGAICITPEHVSDPQKFSTLSIPLPYVPGGVPSAQKDTALLENVAKYVAAALDFSHNESGVNDLIAYNRQQIRYVNDPKLVAQTFLDGAFSR